DIAERRLKASDCVVLGRTARLLDGLATTLNKAGYEAHVVRRKSEFESPTVRLMVESLRLANARHDRDILRRLCLAWDDFVGATIEPEAIAAAAALVGGDFLRAWADTVAKSVSGQAAGLLAKIRSDLVDSLAFPNVVDWFVDQGWTSWCGDNDLGLLEQEVDTWKTLHGEIGREYGSGITLNSYLIHLDLASKEARPVSDSLRCMTVHGAKGLEFKHVYLIGMAQEVFPSFQALRTGRRSRQLEEERRNCFVAITRAEETLTLTRSRTYYGYAKGPSQFLSEMGL
ncbi:MAG: ATP-dependent helicase, partial [Proteobacteria bacterium]|nr:ATP-dependent helicase [Pseudomonadota bacterium]